MNVLLEYFKLHTDLFDSPHTFQLRPSIALHKHSQKLNKFIPYTLWLWSNFLFVFLIISIPRDYKEKWLPPFPPFALLAMLLQCLHNTNLINQLLRGCLLPRYHNCYSLIPSCLYAYIDSYIHYQQGYPDIQHQMVQMVPLLIQTN